jgi:hypothetical protein
MEENNVMRVKKAVIPAAGLGTRFLPATKAMAKEMLPIVDKPTIQFIVEEALKSGIEDILIVTGKAKRPIEDHFDANLELEMNLKEKLGRSGMKGKLAFVVGAGVGYVIGTRAGRAQFEKIKGWASDAWHDPRVQSTVDDLESKAAGFAKEQGAALKDKAVDAVKGAVSRTSDEDAGATGATRSTPPAGTTPTTPVTPPGV